MTVKQSELPLYRHLFSSHMFCRLTEFFLHETDHYEIYIDRNINEHNDNDLQLYSCLYKSYHYFIDPCTNHSIIENEEKRSSAYTYDFETEFAFSDDALEEGWYKVISKSGTEMPTKSPDTFKCGTWYPIWLDGN